MTVQDKIDAYRAGLAEMPTTPITSIEQLVLEAASIRVKLLAQVEPVVNSLREHSHVLCLHGWLEGEFVEFVNEVGVFLRDGVPVVCIELIGGYHAWGTLCIPVAIFDKGVAGVQEWISPLVANYNADCKAKEAAETARRIRIEEDAERKEFERLRAKYGDLRV